MRKDRKRAHRRCLKPLPVAGAPPATDASGTTAYNLVGLESCATVIENPSIMAVQLIFMSVVLNMGFLEGVTIDKVLRRALLLGSHNAKYIFLLAKLLTPPRGRVSRG